MGIDERARHDLFLRLERVLGSEEAETLMEHLPPTGWADVARKRDLDQLAAATKRDLDQLAAATKRDLDQVAALLRTEIAVSEQRVLATLRAEMNAQTRTMIQAMVFTTSGAVVTVATLAFAAARLV
jgi:hypothetical protein